VRTRSSHVESDQMTEVLEKMRWRRIALLVLCTARAQPWRYSGRQ